MLVSMEQQASKHLEQYSGLGGKHKQERTFPYRKAASATIVQCRHDIPIVHYIRPHSPQEPVGSMLLSVSVKLINPTKSFRSPRAMRLTELAHTGTKS